MTTGTRLTGCMLAGGRPQAVGLRRSGLSQPRMHGPLAEYLLQEELGSVKAALTRSFVPPEASKRMIAQCSERPAWC